MKNINQNTIAKIIKSNGIGVHSGEIVHMDIKPAPADSGIVFIRKDVENGQGSVAAVTAAYDLVYDTMLGTTIENSHGTKVATIEHLMAAFWGMGVDNAVIEIDSAEIPIMDGSSIEFIKLIKNAGIIAQNKVRNIIKIDKPISVEEGNSTATIVPHDGFTIDIEIEFPHKAISHQRAIYDFDFVDFESAIGNARTFGFAAEVKHLQSIGLARGGSLDNAIVIGDDGILNEGGLRSDDEFIQHKALDCMGDYFLAGMRIEGKIITKKPGHGINNKMMRALFANQDAWHIKKYADDGQYNVDDVEDNTGLLLAAASIDNTFAAAV